MHIEIDRVYLFAQMHDEQQRLAHAELGPPGSKRPVTLLIAEIPTVLRH